MMFQFADDVERLTDIRVAGVGGAGGNAIGRMIEAGLVGVEFMALNTDLQALNDCKAHHLIQLGAELTSGRGAGGNPDVGQAAAEEDRSTIAQALTGANMVFVTAGMGGGTGTGAAPVVAEVAKELGALTVGIVTRPFHFEGHVRLQQADRGIERLREAVDALIVVPNQRLLEVAPANTSMQEAYRIADNVLYDATRGIFEIISRHDEMNLDFADVCAVMRGMGVAMMGTGRAEGENRALEAARAAISSPLLDDLNIAGSKAVMVNLIGREVELHETAAAMQFIQDAAGPQAHVIFGYGQDESLEETLQVTVIATGFAEGECPADYPAARPMVQADEPEPVEGTGQENVTVEDDGPEPVGEAYPDTSDEVTSLIDPAEEAVAEEGTGDECEDRTETADPAEAAEPREEEPAAEPPRQATADSPLADPSFWEMAAAEDDFLFFEEDIDPQPAAPVADSPASEPAAFAEPETEPGEQFVQLELPTEEQPTSPESVEDELAEAKAEEPRGGFLVREATGGGEDRTSTTTAGNFLKPLGKRSIGEVDVPEGDQDPVQVSRAEAAGLGPGNPGDDRKIPTYIRKYMD
jgi:cell division protein FtsZ